MKKLSVVLILLVAPFSSGTSDNPRECPTGNNLDILFPCTCQNFASGSFIKCENIKDTEVIIRKFKVLREYEVYRVLLHGLRLNKVLPANLFDGLKIHDLRVINSTLKFEEPAFKGLDGCLNFLDVRDNSTIKSSEDFFLAKLMHLSKLNFHGNSLVTVRNEWFNGNIPNVKIIELDNNNISKIENEAFASLSKLEEISIHENNLTSVERSMFPRPANSLRRIDLSWNEITSLPIDFFHQMPTLKQVILTHNRLTTLPEMVWKPVWQDLRKVLLKQNQMICDTNLDWLRDLSWPKEVSAECDSPPERKGKSLKDVYQT